MSMKLGTQHSHIELARKSMQKASRQQQRIILQVIYFTCNKEIRKQFLDLCIQLWQYFLACNQTLQSGRYELALHTIEPTQSIRDYSVNDESPKMINQCKSEKTAVDVMLTLSSTITTNVDELFSLKDDEKQKQKQREYQLIS
uniref:Uncharacterized protein n=1 Tax=Onchocerca volvulus TaxID=6282 RepID=A0A8R1XKF6_ONCVO